MLTISVRDISRAVLLMVLLGLSTAGAMGQTPSWKQQAKALMAQPDLETNTVNVLAPAGDSLWLAPGFSLYLEASDQLQRVGRSELEREDNVVSSIEARTTPSDNRVWAGLAFDVGGGELGAGGFLVSDDGGTSFERRETQLDDPEDTTVLYGGVELDAEPITQQAGSTPRDLAFGPGRDTVWVAGERSGLRWINLENPPDEQEWHRAVLPPDSRTEISPSNANNYDFLVAPPLDGGRGWRNHRVFRVLVDEAGTIWAGTPEGLNRSRAGTVAGNGQRAWDRFEGGTGNALPGDFVVALAEQPRSGRNPIWVATQASFGSNQQSGVAVTEDGGDTFQDSLKGESISDIAVRDTRVYALGQRKLYATNDHENECATESPDKESSWCVVRSFPLTNDNQILPENLDLRSVAVTDTALWVGTEEGLLRLPEGKESELLDDDRSTPKWRLFRAQTPVNPESPTEEAPDVSTYAYPNPFVPSQDQFVRIAYELENPGSVEINIYDFGMNRVRTITDQKPDGQQETVWRGTNDQGLRVPTGTYFYTVDLGGRTVKGKILVAN
jgi:hypothetical protein